MKRVMMQAYVKNSVEAVDTYVKAFGAELIMQMKDESGNYIHAEIDILGNIIAISEANKEKIAGNTMQFCIQYNENEMELIKKAYQILEKDGEILQPLGKCFYSSCMADFIDKYGVRWCLFL